MSGSKKEKFFDNGIIPVRFRRVELRSMDSLIKEFPELWDSRSDFLRAAVIRQINFFSKNRLHLRLESSNRQHRRILSPVRGSR